MTRANRLRVEGGLFHLTHRCHNRSFLLKFAKDRNSYRERMRSKLQEHGPMRRSQSSLPMDWVSYPEMMGHRRRYRLLWRLNDPSLEVGVSEALTKNDRKRQAAWIEGLAVGNQGFVEAARGWISSNQKTEVFAEENDLGVLHDEEVPYTAKMYAKKTPKAPIFKE